jgi:hypothetical protein
MFYGIQARQFVRLTRSLCRMAAARIQKLTLLILDLSYLSKEYARKMEYLARMRDRNGYGLGTGYWLLQIIGAEPGKPMVMPLFRFYASAEGISAYLFGQ